MNEYDSEVAHSGNGINTSQTTTLRPIWQFAIDRSQLFYQGGSDQQIWVASYTVNGDSFMANQPQVWAKAEQAAMADLMPDGKRFIAVLPAEAKKSDRNTHLTFLLNLADDLNRRASDRK